MKRKSKVLSGLGELLIPLIALGILILFNLFRDPAFFSIRVAVNNAGNRVLSGNLENFIVTVEDVDAMVGTVKVKVQMFGREQLVDLPLDQVAKVDE